MMILIVFSSLVSFCAAMFGMMYFDLSILQALYVHLTGSMLIATMIVGFVVYNVSVQDDAV